MAKLLNNPLLRVRGDMGGLILGQVLLILWHADDAIFVIQKTPIS